MVGISLTGYFVSQVNTPVPGMARKLNVHQTSGQSVRHFRSPVLKLADASGPENGLKLALYSPHYE